MTENLLSHCISWVRDRNACSFQALIFRLGRLPVGVDLVLRNESSCSSKGQTYSAETTLQSWGGAWHLLAFDQAVILNMQLVDLLSICELSRDRYGRNICFSTFELAESYSWCNTRQHLRENSWVAASHVCASDVGQSAQLFLSHGLADMTDNVALN